MPLSSNKVGGAATFSLKVYAAFILRVDSLLLMRRHNIDTTDSAGISKS